MIKQENVGGQAAKVDELEDEVKLISNELHVTKIELSKNYEMSSEKYEKLEDIFRNLKLENKNLKKISVDKIVHLESELRNATTAVIEMTTSENILHPSSLSPTSSSSTASLSPISEASSLSPKVKTHPWNHTPLFIPDQTMCSTPCRHPAQCTTRPPRAPPAPSITFLRNERSKYHLHMMSKSVEEFTGCLKCFSVENENYGCDKCTWLKWWFKWHGETHGFPDINPWIYNQHIE